MTVRYFLQLLRKVTKSDDLILSLKIHFFKIFPVKYLLMPLAALRGSLGNIVWSPNPSNIFSKLSQLSGGVSSLHFYSFLRDRKSRHYGSQLQKRVKSSLFLARPTWEMFVQKRQENFMRQLADFLYANLNFV